ncbi:hypothetical protein FRB93_005643 [Tulasnella sp. JGI-2019a]|nr:hypothetical protein FRB93_005643 [Tulasnella sp. JGI-2019a]
MSQDSSPQLPSSQLADRSISSARTKSVQAERGIKDIPISMLAVELLAEIFKIALAVDDKSYYDQLYVLALVCKAWWFLIQSTPEFWKLVDGTDSTWRVALERSEKYPLRVNYDLHGLREVEGYYPGNTDAYWSSIIQHTSRWRYADFVLDTEARLPAFEVPAPKIESFFLTLRRRVLKTPRLLLFGDSNPGLGELNLTNVALRDWSPPWLTGLRYLSLWELKDHALSPLELRTVLRNNPELKVLRLGGIGFTAKSAVDLPPVHLPRLEELEVGWLNPLVIPYLLSGVTALSCTTVNISTTRATAPTIVSAACTEFLCPSLKSQLTRAHQLKIRIQQLNCTFDAIVDNDVLHPTMHVQLVSLSERDIFAGWMAPLLAQLSSTPPEVSAQLYSCCGLDPLELVNTLKLIPNMTELEVWDGRVYLDGLIGALSSPETVDGCVKWMWPKLRRLRLQRLSPGLPPAAVLKMVLNRRGLDKDGEQRDTLDWPEPITDLEIPGDYVMDDMTFNAIQAIVGSGAIRTSYRNASRCWTQFGYISKTKQKIRVGKVGSISLPTYISTIALALSMLFAMSQGSPSQFPPSRVSSTPDRLSKMRLIQADHSTEEETSIRGIAVELLAEIFKNTLVVDDESYYNQLYTLALICKAWWLVIRSTPQLWKLQDGSNPNWRVALERSKKYPLRVIYDHSRFRNADRGHADNLRAYRSSIIRHASRWRSVDFKVAAVAHLPTLEVLTPTIESFFLTIGKRVLETPRLLLVGDSNPGLKELGLTNAALRDWSPHWLTGLRYLSLQELKDHAPSIPELRNILRKSPDLEVLRLGGSRFPTTPLLDLDLPPIHLSRLEKLDFDWLNPLMIPYLLSRVTAPNCTMINISPTKGESTVPAFVSAACTEFLCSSLTPRLTRAHKLKIIIRLSDCILDATMDDATIHVRVVSLPERHIFVGWIAPLLAQLSLDSSPEIAAELHSSCGLKPLELINALRSTPNVTDLEFWDDGAYLDELIKALSSPETVDGRVKWMWPKLRRLSLQRLSPNSSLAVVLEMMRKRRRP